MPGITYSQSVAVAAMEVYEVIQQQARTYNGAEEEWMDSLDKKAVLEEILDFTLDVEAVWSKLTDEQKQALSREEFLLEVLTRHTCYLTGEALKLKQDPVETAECIVSEFRLDDAVATAVAN